MAEESLLTPGPESRANSASDARDGADEVHIQNALRPDREEEDKQFEADYWRETQPVRLVLDEFVVERNVLNAQIDDLMLKLQSAEARVQGASNDLLSITDKFKERRAVIDDLRKREDERYRDQMRRWKGQSDQATGAQTPRTSDDGMVADDEGARLTQGVHHHHQLQAVGQINHDMDLDDDDDGVDVIGGGPSYSDLRAGDAMDVDLTGENESPSTAENDVPAVVVAQLQSGPPTPVISGFTAVNAPKVLKTTEEVRQSDNGSIESAVPKAKRTSLPDKRQSPTKSDSAVSTPQKSADDEDQGSADITKATLCLRDDGVVFTAPPTLKDVPLVKITTDHPYWEPKWPNLEDIISTERDKFIAKDKQILALDETKTRSWTNRQINRGTAVLEYLRDGEIHPYQLMGKQLLSKGLTNYDSLYRMVQVLGELPKMAIDVTPLEWLRQRLHEVYEEWTRAQEINNGGRGRSFNLAKVVHDMYHDVKLKKLRAKAGIRPVGRPLGYKPSEKPLAESEGGSPASPKIRIRDRKRKSLHTGGEPAKVGEASKVPRLSDAPAGKQTVTKVSAPVQKETLSVPHDASLGNTGRKEFSLSVLRPMSRANSPQVSPRTLPPPTAPKESPVPIPVIPPYAMASKPKPAPTPASSMISEGKLKALKASLGFCPTSLPGTATTTPTTTSTTTSTTSTTSTTTTSQAKTGAGLASRGPGTTEFSQKSSASAHASSRTSPEANKGPSPAPAAFKLAVPPKTKVSPVPVPILPPSAVKPRAPLPAPAQKAKPASAAAAASSSASMAAPEPKAKPVSGGTEPKAKRASPPVSKDGSGSVAAAEPKSKPASAGALDKDSGSVASSEPKSKSASAAPSKNASGSVPAAELQSKPASAGALEKGSGAMIAPEPKSKPASASAGASKEGSGSMAASEPKSKPASGVDADKGSSSMASSEPKPKSASTPASKDGSGSMPAAELKSKPASTAAPEPQAKPASTAASAPATKPKEVPATSETTASFASSASSLAASSTPASAQNTKSTPMTPVPASAPVSTSKVDAGPVASKKSIPTPEVDTASKVVQVQESLPMPGIDKSMAPPVLKGNSDAVPSTTSKGESSSKGVTKKVVISDAKPTTHGETSVGEAGIQRFLRNIKQGPAGHEKRRESAPVITDKRRQSECTPEASINVEENDPPVHARPKRASVSASEEKRRRSESAHVAKGKGKGVARPVDKTPKPRLTTPAALRPNHSSDSDADFVPPQKNVTPSSSSISQAPSRRRSSAPQRKSVSGQPKKASKDHHADDNTTITRDDLDPGEITSADSYCGDAVTAVDWRVHQVKTSKIATNKQATQYWHFCAEDDGGEDGRETNILEHQVLGEGDEGENHMWRIYADPLDFHLRMKELTQITFARHSLKVTIGTKEVDGVEYRGDIMALFKRENTKRRFLTFMKKKSVKLVKTRSNVINKAWDEMDPDVLPSGDESET